MEILLLNELSTWQFLLYITALTSAISTLIFILVKRLCPENLFKQNVDLFTLALSVIVANYGFLLGFIIINLWETINHATILTSQEANELSIMVYDTFAFPPDFQKNIFNGIGQYIRVLVQDEWETMKWGNPSPLAENAIQKIFHTIQSYTPQGETQKSYYHDLIFHFNNALEDRRLRLDYLDSILIGPLRFILILGVIVISFFVSIIENKNNYLGWFVLMLMNFVVAFNISLALLLDYPFSGHISVSSAPFEEGNLEQFKSK